MESREIAGKLLPRHQRADDNVSQRVSDETDFRRRSRHVCDVPADLLEESVRHEVEVAECVSLVGLRHEKLQSQLGEGEREVDAIETKIELVPLESVDAHDQVYAPSPPFPKVRKDAQEIGLDVPGETERQGIFWMR